MQYLREKELRYITKTWMDNIKEDVMDRNMNVRVATEVRWDREEWRKIIQTYRLHTRRTRNKRIMNK